MNVLFAAMTASALVLCQKDTKVPKLAEKNGLEGEWAVVVWERQGFWFTALDCPIGQHYRDLRITFSRSRWKITLRENGQSLGWWGWDWVDSPYTLDTSKNPMDINLQSLGRGICTLKE
jgi:hypothetical protein